jgi:pimeloyl-ACP methyl ester carboxylesterase
MPVDYLLRHAILTPRAIPTLTVEAVGLPADASRVFVLHGLHGGKEGYLNELYQLARMGFRATSLDLALHGERKDADRGQSLLMTDLREGMREVIYGTAADVSALIDAWEGETATFGLYGVSAGGLIGHALAVQEKRIHVMTLLIASPDWVTADPSAVPPKGSELEAMLAEISPVNMPHLYPPLALLQMNGALDERVATVGAVTLHESLLPRYESLGISDRLHLTVHPELGHQVIPEMRSASFDWLSRFLMIGGNPGK